MSLIRSVSQEEGARLLYGAEDREIRKVPAGDLLWYAIGDRAVAAMAQRSRVAEFKRCFVVPLWRGRGYGVALLLHRLAEARRSGCKYARVTTPLPRWFLANGWTETRRSRHYVMLERVCL